MLREELAIGVCLAWRTFKRRANAPIPVPLPSMEDMVLAPDLAACRAKLPLQLSQLNIQDPKQPWPQPHEPGKYHMQMQAG
jgi:hypothetical protein